MFIKDTLVSEYTLLKIRIENFKNDDSEENKKNRTVSAFRVASYMAAIGFGLLAAVSTAVLFIPGMIGFTLAALAARDCYHIAKNIDEKEMGGMPLKTIAHGGGLVWKAFLSSCKGQSSEEMERGFNLKRASNLTENTYIARPIVDLLGSFTK